MENSVIVEDLSLEEHSDLAALDSMTQLLDTGSDVDSRDELAEIALTNHMNAQFIGYTYLGGQPNSTHPQLDKVKAIYDTGSTWMWVQ